MTIETALPRLRKLLGDRLSTKAADLDHHGQNEGYFPVTPPDAVAWPLNTGEVADILKICHAESCPVIAWGTGTSLEGHAVAFDGGLTLDMMRMDRILAVHDADLDCAVQPGVTREALNEHLRATGLFFPIDPGANASLGGMTATRASGTTAVRYGTMRENVLALEVVLADGKIIRTGTRARKSSSGYDLTRLFVGSEGTLGIITEITLRLQGQPEAISAATCRFGTIQMAVDTVIATIQSGIPMARIEFVDAMMVRGFNLHNKLALPEQPHLFVEFHGSPAGVAEQAERFGEIVADQGGADFNWTSKAEDRAALWKMRHGAYYAQKALHPGCRVLNTDVCVPISRLAEAVEFARDGIEQRQLTATILGHVGDGNFHCGICIDPENPADLGLAKDFAHALNQHALKLGGTVTGEHGIGRGKMAYLREEHGGAVDVMAAIKTALDPDNILNPGKIIPLD